MEIMSLSGARPLRFVRQVSITWITIALSIAAAKYFGNLAIQVLAILVIATRQNVLGLLIHEQAHHLGLNLKCGDWIANIFCGYPLIGISVENYSNLHLTHHRRYFTKEDPDFVRKNGIDWQSPMRGRRLAMLFLRDLVGLSLLQNIKGKNVITQDETIRRKYPTPLWFKISYFMLLFTMITITHSWATCIIYWVLPLVTVLQAIIRWGALCEHSYGAENATVEESSPVILLSRLEKILLPNLNFTLHPYHHFFPAVSFANLPRVHQIFQDEGLIGKEHVFSGYTAYMKHLLGASGAKSPRSTTINTNPVQL
jgi:fatty acid desaturase